MEWGKSGVERGMVRQVVEQGRKNTGPSVNWKSNTKRTLKNFFLKNLVNESTLRELVKPLFYTRMRLGEFDPPEMNPYTR